MAMNSRTLRRLAADQGTLQSQPLPPNYLFPPSSSSLDDLTQLDILLAGPTHTPFAAGVWKLHLSIPATYPQTPPTANFRTPIFHPNVDPQTGGVCVETLKRDWDSKLTLRDVLVTISCLLIQPNPDSALNAEAGSLIQEDFAAFAKRAELMTSIHAVVPKSLKEGVREAQTRGQEVEEVKVERREQPEAPRRRRLATVRQRATAASRRSDGSPTGGVARRRQQAESSQPLVFQADNDDVFATSQPATQEDEDDSSMIDMNQENDESRSPTKPQAPKAATPRRLPGTSVPLGELTLEDPPYESTDDEEMEQEYPPSPSKRSSPSKSPSKQHQPPRLERAESSRTAAQRAPHITPPFNPFSQPLATNSPFHASATADPMTSPRKSPRKSNLFDQKPMKPLFQPLGFKTPEVSGGSIFKKRSPSSSEKKRAEAKRREELSAKLWELCGRDVRKWNRGEFGGEVFKVKAKRW